MPAEHRVTIAILFLCFASAAAATLAESQAGNRAELVKQLGDRNEQKMMAAFEALAKQGPEVIPALLEALDKQQGCQMQFVASGVLRKLEPGHARIETTLAKLARGECSGGSEQDAVFKQESAFALSQTASGIALLVDMVPHKDLRTRRRVAFAFEDLTEKLNSTMEEFRAPATLVKPTAEALPKLSPFLTDRDEMLRCVTLEAMEQGSACPHASIAAAAKAVLAGRKVDCSR
jgi:hypothetical protein